MTRFTLLRNAALGTHPPRPSISHGDTNGRRTDADYVSYINCHAKQLGVAPIKRSAVRSSSARSLVGDAHAGLHGGAFTTSGSAESRRAGREAAGGAASAGGYGPGSTPRVNLPAGVAPGPLTYHGDESMQMLVAAFSFAFGVVLLCVAFMVFA